MAYFAELDENNVVLRVVAISDQDCLSEEGQELEYLGIAKCHQLFGEQTVWKQTSFNTNGGQHSNGKTPLRKNFASIGYTYDVDKDAFIPPQTFPSWTLNEDTCVWECPVPMPDDGKQYDWDDNTISWVEVQIPEQQ